MPAEQAISIFNAQSMDMLTGFIIRFVINLVSIAAIVRFIYYKTYKNKDFVFTFYLFNLINFIICFLLSSDKINMGFAFGLFAIFSILRYRATTIPLREMAYLFISITIGLINALAGLHLGTPELLLANVIIIATTWALEHFSNLPHENYKQIVYEKIELVKPQQLPQLLADLKEKTGLPIHRVEILKIDYIRDTVYLNAFYHSKENDTPSRGLVGGGDGD
jgi:hypothetical protein